MVAKQNKIVSLFVLVMVLVCLLVDVSSVAAQRDHLLTATLTGAAQVPPAFTDINAALPAVSISSAAWGDYDNDGDLDILLTGYVAACQPIAKVYRNDGGGSFIDIGAGLTGVGYSAVAWGDYDNDGDLDILLSGSICPHPTTKVYRNDGSDVFTDSGALLTPVGYGSVAWGDYDNDGDLDILLTGSTDQNTGLTKIYRNDANNGFTDISTVLPGIRTGTAAWGDYDNDGDKDILLTGCINSSCDPFTKIYRNDGGGIFTDSGFVLQAVKWNSAAWGDYDNDGDLDILLAGYCNCGGQVANAVSKVYRNDEANGFTDINATLPGVYDSSVAWGDYDNDGDLDVLLFGRPIDTTKVYRNDGSDVFTDSGAALAAGGQGTAAWGDYDNDSDLDILITGINGNSKIYRNDIPPNQPPAADPNGPYTFTEGSSNQLDASGSSDPNQNNTTLDYEWDLNYDGVVFNIETTGIHPAVGFPDNFPARTIAVRVTDSGGFTDLATTSLEVTNVAPTATFNSSSPVDEGISISISLTNPFDPSNSDTAVGFTYTFDCDDGSGYGPFGVSSNISCPTNDDGLRTVKGKNRDKDGGETEYTATVIINNVVPMATFANTSGEVIQGESATLVFSDEFDPSPVDMSAGFLYSYDCTNDGAFEADGVPETSFDCSYPTSGTFTGRGRIEDKDGGFNDYTVGVTVLTPQQAIGSLINEVGQLVTGGILTQKQDEKLQKDLDKAIKELDKGKIDKAIGELQNFIAQVNDLINQGVVSPEQGQPLIDAANRVIAALGG